MMNDTYVAGMDRPVNCYELKLDSLMHILNNLFNGEEDE